MNGYADAIPSRTDYLDYLLTTAFYMAINGLLEK